MGRRERQMEKRRQRWGQIAIGILLIFLMVASILQFGSDKSTNSMSYNGQTFKATQQGFTTKLGGTTVVLQDWPLNVNASQVFMQNIYGNVVLVTVDPGVLELLASTDTFGVTFNPESPAIEFVDLSRFDLAQHYSVVSGQLWNSSNYEMPVFNCSAATPQIPVVQLLITNSSNASITLNGNCLTLSGDPQGLLATKDYLILAKYGVFSNE